MKKISVVIPLYNKESNIKYTINSLINQSFKDFEIIIVDDGSIDGSASVVQSINDKRIKLIKKENKGVSSARNTGIRNAAGEYIFFLDADDIALENCFEELVNLTIEYSQASVFAANFIVSTLNNGDIIYCKHRYKGMVVNPFKAHYNNELFLRTGNMLIHHTCFDKVGLFNENLSKYEDLEFSLRLMAHFKIAYTPQVVFKYNRIYADLSVSKVARNNEFAFIVDFRRKGYYEKLLLAQNVSGTIKVKFFVEKDYCSALYLIRNNFNFLHYLVLSNALLKLKILLNRIIKCS